jgi:hypothetical protein
MLLIAIFSDAYGYSIQLMEGSFPLAKDLYPRQ